MSGILRQGRFVGRRSIVAVVAGLLIAVLAAGAGWLLGERTINSEQFAGGPIKTRVWRKGTDIQERRFNADSPEARIVTRWLSAHPGGWTIDMNSYVPKRKVTGERFDLNFHDSYVILNYQDQGPPKRYIQLARKIEPGDVPDVFGPPQPK